MVAKKKTVKKSAPKKKVSSSAVALCSACHSPLVSSVVVDGVARYSCDRCGTISPRVISKEKKYAKELHAKRKTHAASTHRFREKKREGRLYLFVRYFHLRMWMMIISTFLLGFSLVLLPSARFDMGILFFVVGVLGLYAGLKWV